VGPRVTAKPTANFVGHGLTMDSGDIGRWPSLSGGFRCGRREWGVLRMDLVFYSWGCNKVFYSWCILVFLSEVFCEVFLCILVFLSEV
jgi:hypothetical protein